MPQRRSPRLPLLALAALLLLLGGAHLRRRQQLQLTSSLRRALALPFPPRGRPSLHPDGRLFLVTAGDQLVGLEPSGALTFNRRVPGPVTAQPVLVRGDLLVLQGDGQLLGYSLGGEPRFAAAAGAVLGELPAVDERGAIYLLDGEGALRALEGGAGATLWRVPLGLRGRRRVLVLGSGELLVTGDGLLALLSREGAVTARLPLPAPPAGAAASPRPGELAAVTVGTEVLVLGPGAAVLRRAPLPGPGRGAPLLLEDGSVYSYVVQQGSLSLCRAAGSCLPLLSPAPPEDPLPEGPVLGGDGRVYAPFAAAAGLLPGGAYEGVAALWPGGAQAAVPQVTRQALPAPLRLSGLTLSYRGAVLVLSEEERYLWELAGGVAEGKEPGPPHPWPMPLGNPAGTSRPWTARP